MIGQRGGEGIAGAGGVGRGGSGGDVGADHVRQPRDRLHRGPGGSRAGRGSGHRGGVAAGRPAGGDVAAAGPVGSASAVRPAVPGGGLHHRAAGHGAGDPAVSGLGVDQGDRSAAGRADRGPLRGRCANCDRGAAGPAGRGAQPGPEADPADHRGLGAAEGDQGGDGLSAGGRDLHLAGRADLQAVRRRLDRRGAGRALPAGVGGVGHRIQDRRHDRERGRNSARQSAADQGGAAVRTVRGDRAGALFPARTGTARPGGGDPAGDGGAGQRVPRRARRRARRGPRDRPRLGRTDRGDLPTALPSGRGLAGRAAAGAGNCRCRPPAGLRRRGLGRRAGLAAGSHRRRAGARAAGGGAAGVDREGRRPHRRPGVRQEFHGALDHHSGRGQGREDRAGRADRPGGQAVDRADRR